MKRRDKVRYIKKMLHERQMERGYYLTDVPTHALTAEAQQELFDHATEIVEKTTLFPKKVRHKEVGYTVMFINDSM